MVKVKVKGIHEEIIKTPGLSNSFAFTINPRNGIDEKQEKVWVKYFEKNFKFYFMCAEKEDHERHLHGQVWMTNPRSKGDFAKALKRVQEKCDPDYCSAAGKVTAGGVKYAFNRDWIETYLSKEDNWILNCPPDYEEDYYPSQEEQDKVKAKSNAVDKKFHKWKIDYLEWIKDNPPDDMFNTHQTMRKRHIALFLSDMMFKSKKYCVIVDAKSRKQNCDALLHYIYPSYNSHELFLTEDNKTDINAMIESFGMTPEDH